jgi:hypothetical protein
MTTYSSNLRCISDGGKVPQSVSKELRTKAQFSNLVNKYKLGEGAAKDTAQNSKILNDKVKRIIARHGTVQGKPGAS